jgi:hypothetical protein
MTTKYHFDTITLKVYEVEAFYNRAGSDEFRTCVRDSDGGGNEYYVNTANLADTPAQAVAYCRSELEDEDREALAEITKLQHRRSVIRHLLDDNKES